MKNSFTYRQMNIDQRYAYFNALNSYNNEFSVCDLSISSSVIKMLLRSLFRLLHNDQRNMIVRNIQLNDYRIIDTLGFKEISLSDPQISRKISDHCWNEVKAAFDECKSKKNVSSCKNLVRK